VPRRAALLPTLALAAAVVLTGCTDGDEAATPKTPSLKVVGGGPVGVIPVAERPPAPALRGTTLDGEQLDLADLRGSVVVLNFWASWCAPCRAEAKNLVAVAEQTAADGVRFVGVNIKDDEVPARVFEDNVGVPYPSIHDQKGEVLLRFRQLVPTTPPTTLLVDRQGRIAGRFIQAVTETELLGPVQVLAREG
jgi:thiol-disulfide isomerase/thioredoxin